MPCYPVIAEAGRRQKRRTPSHNVTVALAGNPNTGKSALFNALTGLRSQTANFPGTTVERKSAELDLGDFRVELIDLPGAYSLQAATPEECIARDVLLGERPGTEKPDGVVVIVDADNLERNLFLVSQLREFDLPVLIALNMIDIAGRHGIHVDAAKLSKELRCPVVSIIAKTGYGLDDLKAAMTDWMKSFADTTPALSIPVVSCSCGSGGGCPYQSRFSWSEQIASRCVQAPLVAPSRWTEKIDRVLTHRSVGVCAFLGVMLSVFYLIFSLATVPMDMIDGLFTHAGRWVRSVVPAGAIQDLLVEGVIAGVGGILVFLPQICILFFFLALLEDSGYLARATFVMDRLMRRIGLPGTAFVPLLSAHACAIPAIMATRVIQDERDRLVTILVAPLMTCSARIPVYAMVTAMLFPDSPGKAALIFTGAYGLGIFMALVMAFVFKKTILPGETKPLVLELPGYKVPSLKTALLETFGRAKVFVQQAGTIILLISVGLWALASYPASDGSPDAEALRTRAAILQAEGNSDHAKSLLREAGSLDSRYGLEHSFAGRLGKFIEPVVRPLGFDWQMGIGIVTSFAAREVIVSTLAVVYGVGSGDGENEGFYDTLRHAKRDDGSPAFTTAASLSLLVFFVLAMQCLPTQVVTRRETGTWKWAILQLVYMTVLAYVASLVTFQGLRLFGVG